MKKSLKLISLITAMTLVLSACGGAKEPATDTTKTTEATETDMQQPVDEGTEAMPAGGDLSVVEEGAELVYWTMWNEAEPQGMVIQEAVDAFTESTGVKVDINFNGRDIRKTLEPALAAGETIDLFDEDMERVLNVWGTYTLGLDKYINASYEETGGKPYQEVINQTLIKLAQDLGEAKAFPDGNKVHNIPYQPMTFVVMYNKDLFDKAGVSVAPKTWDEFLAACEKLKASGVTPITVDDAYMAALFGYTMDRVAGDTKSYEMVKNRDFSGPETLRVAQIWEDMVKKGYISSKAATNVYPAGQVDEIAKGETAMYLNGTWLPNEIKADAPDLKWGSFAWPAIDASGDGIETNNFGSQSFGINKDTKFPNATFALVRWLTVGEWDQKLADASLGVPMANDATWPAQISEAKAVLDSTTKRLSWAAGMEDDPEISTAIKEGFAKLVSGSFTAQQFADHMKAIKK